MSSATVLYFTLFEPWTKKDIPAAGHGWKLWVGDYPWMKIDLSDTIQSLSLSVG